MRRDILPRFQNVISEEAPLYWNKCWTLGKDKNYVLRRTNEIPEINKRRQYPKWKLSAETWARYHNPRNWGNGNRICNGYQQIVCRQPHFIIDPDDEEICEDLGNDELTNNVLCNWTGTIRAGKINTSACLISSLAHISHEYTPMEESYHFIIVCLWNVTRPEHLAYTHFQLSSLGVYMHVLRKLLSSFSTQQTHLKFIPLSYIWNCKMTDLILV